MLEERKKENNKEDTEKNKMQKKPNNQTNKQTNKAIWYILKEMNGKKSKQLKKKMRQEKLSLEHRDGD